MDPTKRNPDQAASRPTSDETRSGLVPGEGVSENIYDEESSVAGTSSTSPSSSSSYTDSPTVRMSRAGRGIGLAFAERGRWPTHRRRE